MKHQKVTFFCFSCCAVFLTAISACGADPVPPEPAQAPSAASEAPGTEISGGGAAAQERTPEQMEQWDKEHPMSTTTTKEVPFMPTEKDYWEKKKTIDANPGGKTIKPN